jgi:hypothetical protein
MPCPEECGIAFVFASKRIFLPHHRIVGRRIFPLVLRADVKIFCI